MVVDCVNKQSLNNRPNVGTRGAGKTKQSRLTMILCVLKTPQHKFRNEMQCCSTDQNLFQSLSYDSNLACIFNSYICDMNEFTCI